jgi:hypothetical protein
LTARKRRPAYSAAHIETTPGIDRFAPRRLRVSAGARRPCRLTLVNQKPTDLEGLVARRDLAPLEVIDVCRLILNAGQPATIAHTRTSGATVVTSRFIAVTYDQPVLVANEIDEESIELFTDLRTRVRSELTFEGAMSWGQFGGRGRFLSGSGELSVRIS